VSTAFERQRSRAHLAGYKVPQQITFVAAMPRNEIGKVSRGRLRDALLSGTVHSDTSTTT
jgi:acyl-coenzyme A synthetase/AMP-(fatty) acid ligase